MSSNTFAKRLETQGIPQSLYNPIPLSQAKEENDALSLISELCQIYPFHEASPPLLPEFFISHICRKMKNLDDVADATWFFNFTTEKYKNKPGEIGLFHKFLNEKLDSTMFLFYLKARKIILQIKLGDNPRNEVFLKDLMLTTSEWVSIASRLFADAIKPTSCVQKLTSRLFDADYTVEIPAEAFIDYCMQEYYEIKGKNKEAANNKKKEAIPLNSLFYRRPSGLIEFPNKTAKPKPPPRKIPAPPADFDIMKYGKKSNSGKKTQVFDKKPAQPKNKTQEISQAPPNIPISSSHESSVVVDEELHMATVAESPPSKEKPMYYSLPLQSPPWTSPPKQENNNEEINAYKREIEQITLERDHIKEALDETIEFCDTVSYEHDLLLIQNKKLKKMLSLVTDKLIRVDSKLIKDIDFSEIINDPCKEFKPTGILDEKQENGNSAHNEIEIEDPIDEPMYEPIESKETREETYPEEEEEEDYGKGYDMPFSDSAGKNIKKKNIPPTPKFTLGNEEFDDSIFTCKQDHRPIQSGFLAMNKGDLIKKISELDEWYFGENMTSGCRGFFTPDLVSK